MQFVLRVPAGSERGPQYMEQALCAIHQANPERLPLDLQFVRSAGQVSLACSVPDELRAVVEAQFFAAYPDAALERIGDVPPATERQTWSAELHLHREVFPIRRYVQFKDALNRVSADPVGSLLTVLAGQRDSLMPSITIGVRPAHPRRRRRAVRCLERLASPFFRAHHRIAHWYTDLALSPRWSLRLLGWLIARLARGQHAAGISVSSSRQHDREDDLQAAADKLGRHLFEARIVLHVSGPTERASEARRKLHEMAGAFGQFSSPRLASFRTVAGTRRHRSASFLLSAEELATLWHPPTQTVRAPTLGTVESREMEPPVALPVPGEHPDLAVVGVTSFRGQEEPFGILADDRRRHLALVGKTGQGKTTLLQHLVASDVRAGRGIGLLDPHGDLCTALLSTIPRSRTNDVILFDAADALHPLAFNLLQCARVEQRPLVASGIVSAFKKLYGEFWGPRMEHILRNGILALLEVPGATLLTLLRLLSDSRFRNPLVARLSDPVVRNFWQREFASMPPKLQAEAVAPIYNKIGAFLSSPLLRNILGQPRSTLDLRRVMDEGQVLLVNLSKGKLGDDTSALLGSLLVTALQLAAMSRADTAEEMRPDFYLYVDEFQNFATESFATILSEARKYRLALTLANQYLAQLDEATAAALFGNVGTLVSFQVGADDAETLALQLGGDLLPQDLLRLPRYQAYIRLLIDGHPSRPFSMRTLPPPRTLDPERAAIVRRTSRHRYGRPLALAEAAIERTLTGP